MTELADLAQQLDVHERTLRRAMMEGLLRGERPTPRTVELARGERAYLRAHWELLRTLRATLRTEPNVRLAVMIGSAARGRLRADSDIDLLVALADDDRRRVDALRGRLERAAGRPVDLVSLASAAARPLLFHDALTEGRVLVDREARWPVLLADEPSVAARAAQASQEIREEMRALLAELSTAP
jgi:predicted nucleotidyltransferase